ncbi:hypothetical protein FNL37_0559 [Methylovorus glucosotrophus]|uniref:hypothetical protein n=1 Tax=Methylovorus glucosotrophus TaxID=266009 RepID=UPI001331AFA0|nr:hypothetical protein [Methylovorus glucosotrophus]KAF0843141.1 hypothetical protein FNL37_0559 [Methylovorus glucosotrophus]
MTANTSIYLARGLGLLFAVSAAATLFIMFKAGCAGDTKGGSLGNPARAVELEELALFPLLISAAASGTAICFGSQSIYRIAHGAGFAILVLIFLWFVGMYIEAWSFKSCF